MNRNNNNNNNRGYNRSQDRGGYGGAMTSRVNPWNNNMRGNGNDAIALANNLLSNLLRNNQGNVPSLLDMAHGGGYGRDIGYGGGRDFDNFRAVSTHIFPLSIETDFYSTSTLSCLRLFKKKKT
jgi:hypothetical protein